MTLPYSGVTTAYFHVHSPDQPLPPDTPKALRKEWFLDAQWTDLPVEVEEDIKRLWAARELGNDDYMIRETPRTLAEAHTLIYSDAGHYEDDPLNLTYLLQYLREQGVPDDEYVIIHWWW